MAASPKPSLPPSVAVRADAVPPDVAWERLRESIQPLGVEELPLGEAAGRVTAAPVHARWSLPRETNSAMDGIAVHAADGGASVAIVGESRAGAPFGQALLAGQAVLISTGAVLPHQADAVVPIEHLTTPAVIGGHTVLPDVRRGRHVRQAGEDVTAGEVLVPAGQRLAGHHLVALAAAGVSSVPVVQRPRVAVIVTGDEVVPVGVEPEPGQVVDVHTTAVAALAEAAGAEVVSCQAVGDQREALEAACAEAARQADAVILTGGVSVGAHDHTRAALDASGVHLTVERLRMRPGQPTAIGRSMPHDGHAVWWFALPGNPVSAYVVGTLLVAPALRVLGGIHASDATGMARQARLANEVQPDPERWLVLRGRVLRATDPEPEEVLLLDGQASHMMGDLARADALVLVAPAETPLRPGDRVAVLDLPGAAP